MQSLSMQFQHEHNLTKHSLHLKIRYKCDKCDSKLTSKPGLREHMKSVHEGVYYLCNICGIKATTNANLRGHLLGVHKMKFYSCDKCDFKSGRQPKLAKHVEEVHKATTDNISVSKDENKDDNSTNFTKVAKNDIEDEVDIDDPDAIEDSHGVKQKSDDYTCLLYTSPSPRD